MPVLKYIDILIGLSLVMVLVSTIVLAITQVLLNSTFARARHLRRGLVRLVFYVDPGLMRPHALYLSKLLVRHPLVGQRTLLTRPLRWLANVLNSWGAGLANWLAPAGTEPATVTQPDETTPTRSTLGAWWASLADRLKLASAQAAPLPNLSPAPVIQREELAYMMIEFAANEGPLVEWDESGARPKPIVEAQQALAKALATSGVEDPAATLRAIRMKMMENERAEPDERSSRWRSNAVTECGASDFTAKLYASFDGTMARSTDSFTAESSLWVSAVALIVAVVLQLDAFALIKRLSVDDAYRETFVQVAGEFQKRRDEIKASGANQKEQAEQLVSTEQRLNEARESLALLGSPRIDLLPTIAPGADSRDPRTYFPTWAKLPGVLLSWILLSLGSAFWYDALKNLLNLRSVLAKKDDADRKDRADPQSPRQSTGTARSSSAPADVGEAGDLSASGVTG